MTVYTIFGLVAAAAFVLALIRFIVKRPPNILITFLQDFIGAFFIFSGFVKAVDPLGTGYKMHEYFEAFAQEGLPHIWEWLANFSTFFAIVMIAAELFIGFMLIIGWKPRFTVAIIWWLTLFFTLLTGYTYLSGYGITKLFLLSSALVILIFGTAALPAKQSVRMSIVFFSVGLLVVVFLFSKFSGLFFTTSFTETAMKVTDCGCFGDFIKLKPWETFYKDVILDAIILLLLINVKMVRPLFSEGILNPLSMFTAIGSTIFCLYNVYGNEPILDFRPYAVGNNIPELRKEKVPAKIEMTFVYKNKKTGEAKSYTMKELSGLNYDEMEFVERKDVILDPGIPAKITNLRIENDEGINVTDSLLSDVNYSLMVVTYNLKKTNEPAFGKLNNIAARCDKEGIQFYTVTVNDGKVDEFRHRNQTPYPFYHADETPLKTIIRSNPGLVLLKNGTVMAKWHYKHLPTFEELNTNYFSKK